MKTMMTPIIIGALDMVTKEIVQGLEGHGNYSNYSIVEISQNTEKSPGDLRRLTVTQTSVKDYQLMLVGKTCREQ